MSSARKNLPFVGFHQGNCFDPKWIKRPTNGRAFLYGKDIESSTTTAARIIFRICLADIRNVDIQILHRCGNARCHNPHHLYAGNHKENVRDRILHASARARSGQHGLTYHAGEHEISMPQPIRMSPEMCALATQFTGFDPCECYQSDWLRPTMDGYRQLSDTHYSGEVVGAHRKMFQLCNENIDKLDIIRHTCGNKECINPFHLEKAGRWEQEEYEFKFDGRRRPR